MIGSVPSRRFGGIDEIPAAAFVLGDGARSITGIYAPIAGGIPRRLERVF